MTKVLAVKEDWRGRVQLEMAKFAFVDYSEASEFLRLVRDKLGYEGYMQSEKADFDEARRWLRYTGHNMVQKPLGSTEHGTPTPIVKETGK